MLLRMSVVIVFAISMRTSQVLAVIGMSLAAKNKSGTEFHVIPTGHLYISDILAAFSLVGNIVAICLSALGIVICLFDFLFNPLVIAMWTFSSKFAIWFLGGGVALMAAEINAMPESPDTWSAQISFDLLTSFMLVLASTTMTYPYTSRHGEAAKV